MDNYLALARNALDTGNAADALNYCDKALAIDVKNAESWFVKMQSEKEKVKRFPTSIENSELIKAIPAAGNNSIQYEEDAKRAQRTIDVHRFYLETARDFFSVMKHQVKYEELEPIIKLAADDKQLALSKDQMYIVGFVAKEVVILDELIGAVSADEYPENIEFQDLLIAVINEYVECNKCYRDRTLFYSSGPNAAAIKTMKGQYDSMVSKAPTERQSEIAAFPFVVGNPVTYYDCLALSRESVFENGIADGTSGMVTEGNSEYSYRVIGDKLYITRNCGTVEYLITRSYLLNQNGKRGEAIPDDELFSATCRNKTSPNAGSTIYRKDGTYVNEYGEGIYKRRGELLAFRGPETTSKANGAEAYGAVIYNGSIYMYGMCTKDKVDEIRKLCEELEKEPYNPANASQSKSNGCYIATAVYGSYDCPEVWTLRRFRDYTLDESWYGRLFIKCYYATSPTIVKWFGNTNWFKKFWRKRLDTMVSDLNNKGVKNTKYVDKY